MAKGYAETDAQCREIIADARRKIFRPVYLLMGEEPFYPDMVCDAIIANALDDGERDFNQTVCYGADVTADDVITAARRYPMFAERQLVVVKEAQAMKSLEELAVSCSRPLESTVLVIYMHGASADKRKSLYKSVMKVGTVVESAPVRDYEISRWISSYYKGLGLAIDPDAAALLGEYAGTDLGKIAVETEKLRKNLPAPKALKVAAYIGASPRFAMPAAVSALFMHFSRILRYEALLMKDPHPGNDRKAKVLGVNPYFFREYDLAAANYPVRKCMSVIALLRDYDYKGKGGDAGEATPDQLLVELTARILS